MVRRIFDKIFILGMMAVMAIMYIVDRKGTKALFDFHYE